MRGGVTQPANTRGVKGAIRLNVVGLSTAVTNYTGLGPSGLVRLVVGAMCSVRARPRVRGIGLLELTTTTRRLGLLTLVRLSLGTMGPTVVLVLVPDLVAPAMSSC